MPKIFYKFIEENETENEAGKKALRFEILAPFIPAAAELCGCASWLPCTHTDAVVLVFRAIPPICKSAMSIIDLYRKVRAQAEKSKESERVERPHLKKRSLANETCDLNYEK